MQCPYCISVISDQALACPQCARDLYLFKPLLQGIAALEETIAAQKKTIEALEGRLATLERARAADAGFATSDAGAGGLAIEGNGSRHTPAATPAPNLSPLANPLGALLPGLIAPILLLLLAHWLLLFIYDAKPLYLRLVTLILPIPFGAVLAARYGLPFRWAALFSAAAGALAVTGMLGVTAIADKVAFVPQTVRDWRETIEYMFGIGLAVLTGWLILNGMRVAASLRHREPPKVIVLAVKAFKPNEKGEVAIEQMARRVQRMVNAATPAVSGAAAFYAGLRGIID